MRTCAGTRGCAARARRGSLRRSHVAAAVSEAPVASAPPSSVWTNNWWPVSFERDLDDRRCVGKRELQFCARLKPHISTDQPRSKCWICRSWFGRMPLRSGRFCATCAPTAWPSSPKGALRRPATWCVNEAESKRKRGARESSFLLCHFLLCSYTMTGVSISWLDLRRRRRLRVYPATFRGHC